tara:strand:- start:1309 stop:1986 length:678 start_codon:yes stop_codon:yes gene_type:complete
MKEKKYDKTSEKFWNRYFSNFQFCSSVLPTILSVLASDAANMARFLVLFVVTLCVSFAVDADVGANLFERPSVAEQNALLDNATPAYFCLPDGSPLTAEDWNATYSVRTILEHVVDTENTRELLSNKEIQEFIASVPELQRSTITMRAVNDKVMAPLQRSLREIALLRDISKTSVCHFPNSNSGFINGIQIYISTNAVDAHVGHHANDKLGTCDSTWEMYEENLL